MLNRNKIIVASACLSVVASLSLVNQVVADDTNTITVSPAPAPSAMPNGTNRIDTNSPDLNRADPTRTDLNRTDLNRNDLSRTVGQEKAMLPAGITMKDLNSDKSIEKAFKNAAEDAMDKTGFDNLVGLLVDQDRTRIEKSISSGSLNNINGSKNQKLVDVINALQNDWKSKYNHSFDIDYAKVYTKDFVMIQTGEVADANLLVGKWPIDVSLADRATNGANNAAGKLTQQGADEAKNKNFGGNVNLEKGRNVAVVQLVNTQAFGGLNASMIHEAGGWKFDIPNTVDAQKLYDNLTNNLTTVERSHEAWPTDVNEAYRHITAAVVAALYDAPFPGNINKPTAPGAAFGF